ncbi:hypothetical protein BGX23_003462 [Mortierella sp. AD031]|nr:hypothetical protein BGX23_003462 [Mortierella sp. AD031]
MEKNEPMEVRKLNMPLVRHSLILVKKHNKYAALWEALTLHKRIDRLEVHLDVFVYQDAKMPLQGLHLECLSTGSPEYHEHGEKFKDLRLIHL